MQSVEINSRVGLHIGFKKWTKDTLNRHLTKGDVRLANTHRKRCSTPLVIKKRQIKTTVRYFLPDTMAKFQKTENSKH